MVSGQLPGNTGATSSTPRGPVSSTHTTHTGQHRGSPAGQQRQAGAQQRMTDDMFTQLVTNIGQLVGQASTGQAPQGTITDFLSNMGEEFRAPQGESEWLIYSNFCNYRPGALDFCKRGCM